MPIFASYTSIVGELVPRRELKVDVAGECLQEAIDLCTSLGVYGVLTLVALALVFVVFLLLAVFDGVELPKRRPRPPRNPMPLGR